VGVFGKDAVRSDRSDRRKTRSVNGRNVGEVWSDRTRSVRKCVGSVGKFDRSPNTDHPICISIDANKRSRRCQTDHEKGLCSSLKLHHHWQQTFGNAQYDQIDPTRLSERSACSTPFCTDRSDSIFRTHPQWFLYGASSSHWGQ
jgi:hypothetical protein